MALPPAVAACDAAVNAQFKPDLMAAEATLTRLLNESPSNTLYDLITASVRPDAPQPVAQMCAIRAKNFIKNDMRHEHEVDLALVKNALIQTVPEAPDRIRKLLCECARVVHAEESWDDLLPLLVAQLSQCGVASEGDADASRRALSALHLTYVIVLPFKKIGMVSVEEQRETSDALLPLLPPLFKFSDLNIAHMAFKIFEALVLLATPPSLKGDLFDGWMNFMLEFASSRRPEYSLDSADYRMYVKCMKRVASVSYRMVQLAARRGKKQPKVAAHFVSSYGGHFVSLWVEWLRFLSTRPYSEQQPHAKVSVSAIRFLRECAAIEPLYPQLPLGELCTSLLFPYFPFNEDDEELWASDVNEYLRRLADPVGQKTDVRHSATKALLTFVTAKKAFHNQASLQGVLEFVHNGLQQPTTRETDGFLHMLGMLKKAIRKVPSFYHAMEGVLVSCIAPLMQSPSAVLRAKAIWICGLYASSPFSDASNFEAMLRAVLGCLDDSDAPVRMQVVASLAGFLSLKRTHPYLRDVLGPLTRECVRLIDDNNSDFAVTALQALVEVFGPELSSHMAKICGSLVQRCKAALFDIQATANQFMDGDMEYDEDGDAAAMGEKGTFAAETCLKAISSCVEAIGYDSEALAAIEADVCSLVNQVLEDNDLDLTEQALKVLDTLVYFRRDALSEAYFAVVPVLHRALMEGAVDLFKQYLNILDNMVTGAPASFATPERLRLCHEMAERMLSPEVAAQPEAITSAPELISVLFLQLRDYRQVFDEAAANFLQLTLTALQTSDKPAVKAGLCTAVMSAMVYSAEATLATLDAAGAAATVLGAYCDLLSKRGFIEKRLPTTLGRKVHVLGIVSYLRCAMATGRAEASDIGPWIMQIAARCVRLNLPVYQKNIVTLNSLLAGQSRQHDDDEGYESDDSMDVDNPDAAHEADEGDDGAGYEEDLDLDDDYDTSGSRLRAMGGGDGDDDDDDDDDFEMVTTIDPICEVAALNELIAQCPEQVQQAVVEAWPTAVADFPSAQEASAERNRLAFRLRDTAKELHQSRAAAHQ